MSTSWKVFIGVLVVVGALFGFNYFLNSKNGEPVATNTQNTQTPAPINQVAPTPVPVGLSPNTGLDQDLSTIDAQLNIVNTNSAGVDSSLNDKPVAQTE